MTAMIQDFKIRGLPSSSPDSCVLLWIFFFLSYSRLQALCFKFSVAIAALPLATLYI